jgi:hypothetical protein
MTTVVELREEKQRQIKTTAFVTSYLPSTYLTNILNNALFCVTTAHSRANPQFHKIISKCNAMQALGPASRLTPLLSIPSSFVAV